MYFRKPTAGRSTPSSAALRAPLPPTERQATPQTSTALVESQETTRHLGDRRKRRKPFGDLSRVAGFLL
jgi:hypothetical protein